MSHMGHIDEVRQNGAHGAHTREYTTKCGTWLRVCLKVRHMVESVPQSEVRHMVQSVLQREAHAVHGRECTWAHVCVYRYSQEYIVKCI